ncbi:FAD-binding domain-containing protein [Setomelanomma holmii]|uniref:FAD-binding domain-containing protein n=1 Tax=Setomelanomma holmii TaxID=210430 RepID=A0A9P4LPY7_9PLEO|nr:FAD-binding domain-containing protein [Setomelanomma holmii]
MHSHYFLSLLLVHVRSAPTTVTLDEDCKCVPGDPCWPSKSDFDALNNTLSGNLIQAVPLGSLCYKDQPDDDTEACKTVRGSWFSSTFHALDPISIGDVTAGSKGYSIGSYPVYSVNATSEDHVVAAIKVAKEKNVRLNVKSTGHSYQGRTTAFGSLSVWTHYMRGIQYHDNFIPESCPRNSRQMAFTIAAGMRGREVYEATAKYNAVVVAGSPEEVGIVGHFSSGGHGPLPSDYGLAIDNVLEVRIVTPDGELCTANLCVNSDLFWALRGGGRGTFGVMTFVTMKAYPLPQGTRHNFALSGLNASNQTAFWDLVAYIMSELPRMKAAGLEGYSFILPPAAVPGAVSWTWEWGFNLFNKPNGTSEALFAPIKAKLDPLNGTVIYYQSDVTCGVTLGSCLRPASVLQELAAPAPGQSMAGQTGRDGSVSVIPAWADTVIHFIISEGFRDNDKFTEAQPVFDRMTYEQVKLLKGMAPESGAYQNEGDPLDPNWQYDFYGPDYARLNEIKQVNDPDPVLWCISCVGSEEWAPDETGRLCKRPWADLDA